MPAISRSWCSDFFKPVHKQPLDLLFVRYPLTQRGGHSAWIFTLNNLFSLIGISCFHRLEPSSNAHWRAIKDGETTHQLGG